ncbi:MAG: Methionine--tRNA ligase [Planctomycetes bacterium]|nr:Methionine--tRNA ligase [Planctomycetota bacterium]
MPPERFYVTTPIYYVSGTPHVGSVYTTVMADVFARFHRMLGIPTFFLTGTDEHGEKAQLAAEARGISPAALCDEYSAVFRSLFARYGVSNDDFIRTTEPRHERTVARVLGRMHAQGDLYRASYEGFYCTRCETFFTDQAVRDAGDACPEQPVLHGKIQRLSETNWFFRTSKYAPELARRIEAGEMEIVPARRRQEVLGLLRDVQDLCVSRHRSRVSWGIPLPFDPEYVCYVWIDALFNYRTATGYLDDDAARRADDAAWWAHATHLIGKDILKHHTVLWGTFLLAMGEPLPRREFIHGWLLDERGLKVSKTQLAGAPAARTPGAEELLAVVGRDAARYALVTAMRGAEDAPFSWNLLRERLDAELANGFGNSVNRVVRMIHQSCGGRFPGLDVNSDVNADVNADVNVRAKVDAGARAAAVREAALAVPAAVRRLPDILDVHEVLGAVRAGVQEISLFLDEEKPWKAAKDPANLPRVGATLATALEALRLLSLGLHAVCPEKMAEFRAVLGLGAEPCFEPESRWGLLAAGAPLGQPPGLFPRFDDAKFAAAVPDAAPGAG